MPSALPAGQACRSSSGPIARSWACPSPTIRARARFRPRPLPILRSFDRLRSVAIHEGIVRDLVHGLKYRDRTDLAPMMAEWMIRASDGAVAAADMIVPVPLLRSASGDASSTRRRSLHASLPNVPQEPIGRMSFAASSARAGRSDSVPGHARTMSAAPSQYPKARSGNSRASASFSSTTSIRPARPSPPRPGR